MTNAKQRIKAFLFRLFGIDGEPVIVCALSGDEERAERMAQLMRELVPDLQHLQFGADPALTPREHRRRLKRELKGKRIALAAVLFDGDPRGDSLRRAMLTFAPHKILAFNAYLDRYQLSLASPISSWLFVHGFPFGLKAVLLRLLGLDGEPVIVSVLSGDETRAARMAALMRELVPDLEHFQFGANPELTLREHRQLLKQLLQGKRVALAAVLFDGDPRGDSLRRAMLAYTPRKILAFNAQLDRYHLSLASPISSWLFVRGVPFDRIGLRPAWLCPWKKDRSVLPTQWRTIKGRGFRGGHPRAAILSPYLPWPLSHGGAVRIWNLLRECSRRYDILFFGFEDGQSEDDLARVAEICPYVFVANRPRYREPRWSTLRPPEVCEFYSKPLDAQIKQLLTEHGVPLLQVEYTQAASYGGDVLVEHDVTFDLFTQVHAQTRSLSSWWNLFRWRRFETRAVRRYRHVIAMSEKDTAMLGIPNVTAVPNGVDLQRFTPTPEPPGEERARLLFIGSFRHFPNRQAWEFFTEEVWPLLADIHDRLGVTCVAGPHYELYWNRPAPHDNIEVRGFTADVKPLYDAANLVLVPTVVSAGTNLKALEAMATERAMVSTPSGVGGLGLTHGDSVWIGTTAQELADGIRTMLSDPALRRRITTAARDIAVKQYGWPAIARIQLDIWDSLSGVSTRPAMRPMESGDFDAVAAIQGANAEASQWSPEDYLSHDARVAVIGDRIVAFVVTRATAPDEIEILNVAVAPEHKREGLATQLLAPLLESGANLFLEVRESNEAALALYTKLGFVVTGRRSSYYSNPMEDALALTRAAC